MTIDRGILTIVTRFVGFLPAKRHFVSSPVPLRRMRLATAEVSLAFRSHHMVTDLYRSVGLYLTTRALKVGALKAKKFLRRVSSTPTP